MKIKIAPSILSADFSRLGEEIIRLEQAGADMIHIDVMDGSFVPNITIGAEVVKSLRKFTELPFDVHLMIRHPENHIESFVQAGADIITVQLEACIHLHQIVQTIKSHGKIASVALNPHTSLSGLDWILPDLGMVLIMSVNPGYGGQKFIDFSIEKISALRNLACSREVELDIQVDGGIHADNISAVTAAGANVLVSGSAIFNASDMKKEIERMRHNARFS